MSSFRDKHTCPVCGAEFSRKSDFRTHAGMKANVPMQLFRDFPCYIPETPDIPDLIRDTRSPVK